MSHEHALNLTRARRPTVVLGWWQVHARVTPYESTVHVGLMCDCIISCCVNQSAFISNSHVLRGFLVHCTSSSATYSHVFREFLCVSQRRIQTEYLYGIRSTGYGKKTKLNPFEKKFGFLSGAPALGALGPVTAGRSPASPGPAGLGRSPVPAGPWALQGLGAAQHWPCRDGR